MESKYLQLLRLQSDNTSFSEFHTVLTFGLEFRKICSFVIAFSLIFYSVLYVVKTVGQFQYLDKNGATLMHSKVPNNRLYSLPTQRVQISDQAKHFFLPSFLYCTTKVTIPSRLVKYDTASSLVRPTISLSFACRRK